MTLPALSDPGVMGILILLALHGAWLIICLFIALIDRATSMVTLKSPNERIGYLYFDVAIAINVIYSIVTLYTAIRR